jgi:hypothetical protein
MLQQWSEPSFSSVRATLQSDLTCALAPLAFDPFVKMSGQPLDSHAVLDLMNKRAEELGIQTQSAQSLRFVIDTPKRRRRERKPVLTSVSVSSYEHRVWASGEVPTRPGHVHDLCNFAVWCLFPHAKAALNARQIQAAHRRASLGGEDQWSGRRTPEQDALSMLDEGSVVEVVLEGRQRATSEWFIFGHALYESMIQEISGIRGMHVKISVDGETLPVDREKLRMVVDQRLATLIANEREFKSNHDYGSVRLDELISG